MPDKVHPMDALTATKPGVFVIDIKTIPALQPQHKFLNLLLEITRLFTFKGVPLIGKKNVKSRKTISSTDRNHDIAQSNADAQPTNRRINHHQTAEDYRTSTVDVR